MFDMPSFSTTKDVCSVAVTPRVNRALIKSEIRAGFACNSNGYFTPGFTVCVCVSVNMLSNYFPFTGRRSARLLWRGLACEGIIYIAINHINFIKLISTCVCGEWRVNARKDGVREAEEELISSPEPTRARSAPCDEFLSWISPSVYIKIISVIKCE